MSDQAPERTSRGNVFTRKIGPLPMWQWFLIALAMLGIYVISQYRKNSSASSGSSAATAAGTTSASQVPQFVNQTYVSAQPPVAAHPRPRPGAGSAVGGSAGANIAGGLAGTPLSQALQTLQQNGITVNTVTNASGQHVNPGLFGTSAVTKAVYYPTGQAGDHFANSVTLFIQ